MMTTNKLGELYQTFLEFSHRSRSSFREMFEAVEKSCPDRHEPARKTLNLGPQAGASP